jgi:hypothetical protein
MMPNTYVMHWLDTLKALEWTTLYKWCFEHVRCSSSPNLLFSKPLFSRLCYSLFGFATRNWGKETWVKQIVKREKIIVSFIQQHHVPLAIFCCYETKLMFLNHNKTWFATFFFYGWTIVQIKSCNWTNCYKYEMDNLCQHIVWHGHHHKSFTKAKYVQANIRRDKFWELVLMPLMAFDSKQPIMGRAWLIMKT